MRHLSITLIVLLVTAGAFAQAPDWSFDYNDYDSNMNITGAVYVDGVRLSNPGDKVAAFVGSELRGVQGASEFQGENVHYMLVYANTTGEIIHFKVYDAAANEVRDIEETLVFSTDGAGTPTSPFQWTVETTSGGGDPPGGGGTTPQAPTAPTLTEPANGASGASFDLSLDWQNASGADYYDVEVGLDAALATPAISQETSSSELALVGLEHGATYYWRVRAGNEVGESDWSATFSFTTAAVPNVPALFIPANGAAGVPIEPALQWQALDLAETYELQLSEQPDFSLAVSYTGLPEPQVEALPGLDGLTTYYWHVRGHSADGVGEWSDTYSFTTASGVAIEENNLPDEVVLEQSRPNPFREAAVIRYALPAPSQVHLVVHDLLGRRVATLVDERQGAGWKSIQFTPSPGLPSGLYFYRLQTDGFSDTGKMVLVR